MIEKKVFIVNGMTGQTTPVKIDDKATPEDILNQVGLENLNLARVSDRHVLPPGCQVSSEVQNNDRLFAFAPMIVGVGK